MYMYIFVIFVHEICEEGRELAAIRNLPPAYPLVTEVITKIGLRCRGFILGCGEKNKQGSEVAISEQV